jgi:hypothetical protein
MRALPPSPPKKLFLVDDVVTTSSAFLTDKGRSTTTTPNFFFPAFLKSKEHVYTTPPSPLKKPASQPALIVFSHSGPTKKSARKKEMGGWVGVDG